MSVILFTISLILIGRGSYGGMILHDVRDHMHSKLFGHGASQSFENSPIINVNNYQEVSQQDYSQNQQMYGFQPSSIGGHSRGDHGTLSNYGQHLYGAGGFMNSNIKAGGLKYDNFGGYGNHNSMKQESYYHHREGPKFGQHHDTNMFGNAQIGSSSSSSSSASSSGGTSAAASSSSSSSSIGGGDNHYNTRVKPWLY